jgi:hypothetical protein
VSQIIALMGENMKRLLLVALGFIALVLTFQNCGKAGFDQQDVTGSTTNASSVDPKLAGVSFPYDVSVNQIAHMSCAMNTTPTAATPFFSWKVAAFENPADVPTAALNIRTSGLKLRPEFITYFNSTTQSYTADAKKEYLRKILKSHPLVGDSQLQLSFRDTQNPRTKLMQMPAGGNSPTALFMAPLNSDGVVDKISSDQTKTYDFFAGVPDLASRGLEGKLIIPSSQGLNNTALQSNYDASYFVLGFQTSAESTNLSGPAGDTKAYGKAYRAIFGTSNPHQGTTYYPARDSLVGINETDLETKAATGASWDCSYRFKIVRPQDRYNTYYRANNFSMISGSCPGPVASGTFCASPVNPSFGLSNTFFPNSQCPSNRVFSTGNYCVEKYATICPPEPFNANTSSATAYDRTDGLYNPSFPQRAQIFHALRRILPASEWDVNISRGCIVPKADDNSCYSTSNIVYDDYFSSLTDANSSMGRNPGCGVDIAGVGGTLPCAAYLTLCLRR